MPTDSPKNLPTTGLDAGAEALTQADEYESLFGTTDLLLDDGDVIKVPPHPDYGMCSDEAQEAYDELLFVVDTQYDREPDIQVPEQKLENGFVLPAETRRGALKSPSRIKNELVKPPHTVKVAQIALGEVEYKRLQAGGRSAADVWKIWGQQGIKMKERQQRDSKSNGGALAVAPVPTTDS